MRRTTQLMAIVMLAAALAALGCQPQTELEPIAEDDMELEVSDDVAETTLAGFSLTVDGDAWQGDVAIENAVTPLKVEITNASAVPLSVEYSNFMLVGAAGEYEAMPVFPYDVVHGEPELKPGFEAPAGQELEAVGFQVAPYYAPLYPELEVAPALLLDRDYYGHFLTAWEGTGLPSEDMQRLALPEGILLPEGTVTGFLYFEPVAELEDKVNLLVQLENAETNELEGTFRIPMAPEATLEP
ncbi:MAG TPA: hypothetical protein VLT32_09980 [Candidatus Sulfomarinibacteraceae bacterium]|nr:hypothetical protein [Candidatus Sulfomarinibacteraceae bacterium]